jgi:hypothetical protein
LKSADEKKVFHSETGRIAPVRMFPMSLYESGDSTGEASLAGMLDGEIKEGYVRKIETDIYNATNISQTIILA